MSFHLNLIMLLRKVGQSGLSQGSIGITLRMEFMLVFVAVRYFLNLKQNLMQIVAGQVFMKPQLTIQLIN